MLDEMSGPEAGDGRHVVQDRGMGCVVALIALNAMLMGLLVSAFAFGQYSSVRQEIWYRCGLLGFLFGGAILPAAALALGARRSPAFMLILISWMVIALFACCAYAMMSGGGV